MEESPNFFVFRNKINNWDIEAEEMLLRKMKLFTDNYLEQFNQFSKNMDSLDLHLVTAEVENYKAFSKLKILSNNQFIEDILEKKEETSEPIEDTNNIETPKDIIINDIEAQKNTINISLQNLQEIQSKKGRDKEQIEDDTVSVSSSKLNLDNFSKYIRMPFIIGTADFEKDKTLGLTIDKGEEDEEENKNKKEDNDSEDSDEKEFLENIPVDEKRKRKWQKIKEKKDKIKQAEKLKRSQRVVEGNHEFEEDKVTVPKETEAGFLVVENGEMKEGNNNIIENKGGQMTIQNQNEIGQKEVNVQNPNNNIDTSNKENNNAQKNNMIIMPKNENADNNNQKMENNNNENNNPVTVESLKKNNFNSVRIDKFLAGADPFPDDDEDDDMDDGLFSRKNRKIPVIPTQIPNPNPNLIQNPNQNNNIYQSQIPTMPQIIKPPIDQNPIQNNNTNGRINNLGHWNHLRWIHIPQNNIPNNNISNTNLGLAKKKLSNIFGDDSDDDEDIKPTMVNEKKEDNNIENNLFKKEEKIEIKEEKKENKEEEKEIKIELNRHKRKSLIIADEEENEIKFEKKESSKDKMVNSLFSLPEEDEKKNSNEIKAPEKAQIVQDKKESQKRLAFLFDDDE